MDRVRDDDFEKLDVVMDLEENDGYELLGQE